jgi:hypothetical protein
MVRRSHKKLIGVLIGIFIVAFVIAQLWFELWQHSNWPGPPQWFNSLFAEGAQNTVMYTKMYVLSLIGTAIAVFSTVKL